MAQVASFGSMAALISDTGTPRFCASAAKNVCTDGTVVVVTAGADVVVVGGAVVVVVGVVVGGTDGRVDGELSLEDAVAAAGSLLADVALPRKKAPAIRRTETTPNNTVLRVRGIDTVFFSP